MIVIRGKRELELKLKLLQAKMEAAAPTAEHAGATVVAQAMANNAPVDTGYLRSSIRAVGSEAVATAPYAVYVKPFAAAAANEAESEVIASMAAVFKAALRI